MELEIEAHYQALVAKEDRRDAGHIKQLEIV